MGRLVTYTSRLYSCISDSHSIKRASRYRTSEPFKNVNTVDGWRIKLLYSSLFARKTVYVKIYAKVRRTTFTIHVAKDLLSHIAYFFLRMCKSKSKEGEFI